MVRLPKSKESNVLPQRSLYFDGHSGLDPESSISELDSRFRGNDSLGIIAEKRWKHCTKKKETKIKLE